MHKILKVELRGELVTQRFIFRVDHSTTLQKDSWGSYVYNIILIEYNTDQPRPKETKMVNVKLYLTIKDPVQARTSPINISLPWPDFYRKYKNTLPYKLSAPSHNPEGAKIRE